VVTLDDTPSTYAVALDKTTLKLTGTLPFASNAPGAVTRAAAVPSLAELRSGSVPTTTGDLIPR
jgi:hypothetical protein